MPNRTSIYGNDHFYLQNLKGISRIKRWFSINRQGAVYKISLCKTTDQQFWNYFF
jgi:hypothetical protein